MTNEEFAAQYGHQAETVLNYLNAEHLHPHERGLCTWCGVEFYRGATSRVKCSDKCKHEAHESKRGRAA